MAGNTGGSIMPALIARMAETTPKRRGRSLFEKQHEHAFDPLHSLPPPIASTSSHFAERVTQGRGLCAWGPLPGHPRIFGPPLRICSSFHPFLLSAETCVGIAGLARRLPPLPFRSLNCLYMPAPPISHSLLFSPGLMDMRPRTFAENKFKFISPLTFFLCIRTSSHRTTTPPLYRRVQVETRHPCNQGRRLSLIHI